MFLTIRTRLLRCLSLTFAAAVCIPLASAQAWEPSKTIEFIVPAGTGGGADQMARLVQGIISKNKLSKQSVVVVNKAGGAGAEGFLDMKAAKGDPHKIIISLSNLFTTPLATGVPFNWTEMTPVSMLALDQFVLWVHSDSPYKNASDFLKVAKTKTGAERLKIGGTGSKQEDQIITAALEKQAGAKFIYLPFKGGGDVAVQLVGKHIDATVNNPIEAVAQWRAGQLRPLCVFDEQPMPFKDKVTDKQSWGDIATCKSQGVDVQYLMLRGIFMAPGVTEAQRAYYVDLLNQVRATGDWKDFMFKGAFNQTSMSGAAFSAWLAKEDKRHENLMREAGFISEKK